MSMRRARKQFQFVEHVSSQRVLRQHSLHCQLQNLIRLLRPHVDRAGFALTTRPARVTGVDLLGHLRREVLILIVFDRPPCESHFVRVEDNHVIARINVRSVFGPVLAHQNCREPRCEVPHNHSTGIDHKPSWLTLSAMIAVGSLHKRRLRSNHVVNLLSKLLLVSGDPDMQLWHAPIPTND